MLCSTENGLLFRDTQIYQLHLKGRLGTCDHTITTMVGAHTFTFTVMSTFPCINYITGMIHLAPLAILNIPKLLHTRVTLPRYPQEGLQNYQHALTTVIATLYILGTIELHVQYCGVHTVPTSIIHTWTDTSTFITVNLHIGIEH